jgi:hypothetical protein
MAILFFVQCVSDDMFSTMISNSDRSRYRSSLSPSSAITKKMPVRSQQPKGIVEESSGQARYTDGTPRNKLWRILSDM